MAADRLAVLQRNLEDLARGYCGKKEARTAVQSGQVF